MWYIIAIGAGLAVLGVAFVGALLWMQQEMDGLRARNSWLERRVVLQQQRIDELLRGPRLFRVY